MKPSQEISSLETHLGYWMRFVSNSVSHTFKQSLEGHGVTVAEWVVLRALWDHEHTAPSQLAAELGMTRGTISKLGERLVRKGLVLCQADTDDRRYLSLELSKKGRALVPRLAKIADENDARFFGHLDKKQQQALMKLLRDIAQRQQLQGTPVD